MAIEQGRIFVCDDQPEVQQLLGKALESRGHQVELFASSDKLLRALEEHREESPDLILLDARPSGTDSVEVLRRIKSLRADQAVVMMSAFGTVRGAVEALKQGASDYLLKPFLNDELYNLVDRLVGHNRLLEENRSLKAEIRRRFDPGQVVFKSAAFRRVFPARD